MARIRSLKPSFFSDERLAEYPRDVRLTFLGLISHADDEGRLKGDPRLIKAQVWPLDDDITVATTAAHLEMLSTGDERRIDWYEVAGRRYIEIRNFKRHQYIQKPRPSELPPPPTSAERSGRTTGTLPDGSQQEAERMGMDRERKGSGAGARAPSEPEAIPPDPDPLHLVSDAAPPAPRLVLPVHAQRLVDEVYGLATAKRRMDVARQLAESIDPAGRGARLRRGAFVKARSVEHLDECCKAVLYDLPRNPDMAVVFVLEKLGDPPPGPTPTELAKQRDEERRAVEERYFAESKAAGLAWARDHPDAYRELVDPIEAQFAEVAGTSYGKLGRDAALVKATAHAAGFPPFDQWAAERGDGAAIATARSA